MVALSLGNQKWEFTEYTPEEFIKYSTIPPFKIFFRVPISEKEKSKKRRNISAVTVSEDKINKHMMNYFLNALVARVLEHGSIEWE